MERPLLVYTPVPDADAALAVARPWCARLAACLDGLPGMRSVHARKGAVERGEEVAALVKSAPPWPSRWWRRRKPVTPTRRGDPDPAGGGRATLARLAAETRGMPGP